MDKLIDSMAECLCRHRSVVSFRLTPNLMRRRLDLFTEVGAVEVVSGARHRDVAAKRRHTPSAREGRPSRRRGGVSQLDRPVDKLHIRPPSPALGTAKNGVPFRLFSLFSFFGAPKNGASLPPNAV